MSRYYDDELYHHGIKGQSWGAQNGPPYPLNAAGKARFRDRLKQRTRELKDGAASIGKKVASVGSNYKEAKATKKALKIEEKAAKKQEQHQRNLENLAKSPTYLYKHRDSFTTEELNQALNRINTEQRLHQASMQELKRGKDIVDTIIGYGKTINDAYKTANDLSANWKSFKNGEFGKKKSDDGNDNKKSDNKNSSDNNNPSSTNSNTDSNSNTNSNTGSKSESVWDKYMREHPSWNPSDQEMKDSAKAWYNNNKDYLKKAEKFKKQGERIANKTRKKYGL